MRRKLATLTLLAALLGAAAPCAVRAASARFPVTLADVAAALAAQHPELSVSGLDVPLISASSPDPTLVIGTVRAAGPGMAEVRIACRDNARCLPFYVRIHSPGTGRVSFTLAAPARRQPPPGTLAVPPAVRSGARAVLHLDGGRLHITLPVICLASGKLGSEIRVTGLDHRMIYTVRIVSPSLMEGSL